MSSSENEEGFKIQEAMVKEGKQIDFLTPEQEAKIAEYRERFKKMALNTEPVDRAKAEEAVKRLYAYLKQDEPVFEWVDNPIEGAKRAAQEATGRLDVTAQEIRDQANYASYGSLEACYIAFFSFIQNELPVERHPLVDIAVSIVENCGVFWAFEGLVIMTERPKEIHLKDGQLHNTEGYALGYKDWGIYAINGEIQKKLADVILKGMMDFD
jgi:hypothetical protein